MTYRITDATMDDRLVSQLSMQRERLATAQEQVASGKRINRPSDDPHGAAAVIEIHSSEAVLAQFEGNQRVAATSLSVTDGALDSYQLALDRASTLLAQGISDTTPARARQAAATEIEGLRQTMLGIANKQSEGYYIFGGTYQDAAPFDPYTGVASAVPTSARLIQVEPGAPAVEAGVRTWPTFANGDGTVFEALASAAAALRGTGDEAADKATLNTAMDQVKSFLDASNVARAIVGKNMNIVQAARDRTGGDSISLQESAENIEGADFAKSSVALVEAERALEATIESSSHMGKKTLLDLLG